MTSDKVDYYYAKATFDTADAHVSQQSKQDISKGIPLNQLFLQPELALNSVMLAKKIH